MSVSTTRAVVERPAVAGPTRWQRWRFRHRQAIEAWVILTPVLLYYLLFAIVPVVLNLSISFTRWNGISGTPQWVGLANYVQYLKPPYPLIIFNTALFAVTILVVQTVVAFFIALLLNEKVIGRGAYRAMWYIPTLTSAAIMAQIAVIFISPFDGVLNAILKSVGHAPVVWTVHGSWMRLFIVVFSIWRGVGGPVVLFLAGLQGIHPELYEAAMVDGARGRELLRYITVPLLRPMILFVVVTSIIGGFQIFEPVLLITKGGPLSKTNVMLLQIYNDAFVNTNLGVASAGAVIMALILLWFSLINMRLMSQGQAEA
jgi:ABC-type sugar transport system permease subunit